MTSKHLWQIAPLARCPRTYNHVKLFLQHMILTRPWQVVGTDLFSFKSDNFLIIADYYSKFPFVRKLPVPCTSSAVINATKQILAEHGIPERVASDNA